MKCGKCEATGSDIVRNGHTTTTGKQKYKCMKCGYQFVENPAWKPVSTETKRLTERLLLERLSLAGISRAVQVSSGWLQGFVNELYAQVPRQITSTKKKGQLLLWNVMNSGLLSIKSSINNGFGWRLIVTRVRLLASISATEAKPEQGLCGTACHQFTDNAPRVIPTIGAPMAWCFPPQDTRLSARKAARQIILNASIAP